MTTSTSELEAELHNLESQKELYLTQFNHEKNVNCSEVNIEPILTKTVELCCKILRKTLDLKDRYEENVRIIDSEIERSLSEKGQREQDGTLGSTETKNRHHRKRDSIFTTFSPRNIDQSFYFRSETRNCNSETERCRSLSEWCRPENEDLIEIRESGFKFAAFWHVQQKWGKMDRERLQDAVMRYKRRDNVSRMQELYYLLQLPVDEETTSYIERRKEELTAPPDVSKIYLNAENIDWNLVSTLLFHGRRKPEELKAMWTLIANPRVQTKEWTLVEDILLRCLAQSNGFQNWEYINEQMPTFRSGLLCFSRYMYLYKWKGAAARRWWKLRRVPAIKRHFHEPIPDYEPESECPMARKRGAFTRREKFVVYHYLRRGYSFKAVARMLPSRTEKQIREHYHTSLSRKYFGPWTRVEDSRLLWATRYLGHGNWRIIREFTNGRTSDQCRTRFRYLMKRHEERVRKHLNRKFETPKILQNKIKRFLAKKSTKPKVDRRIELYFYLQLDRAVQEERDRVHLADDVLKILRFLNFDLSFIPRDDEFTKWLVDYPQSSDEAGRLNDEMCSTEFTKLRRNLSTWPRKLVKTVFSHVLYRKCKVLPPNKSGIYGLLTFEQQYQNYFDKNNHIDFGKLWKEQNDVHGREKHFNEAKMLWYNVLKAILYWPLKLKTIGRPEDFLL